MDFFQSQESLTVMQWILRAIVAFFFLLFIAKIMGQRSLSQLRLIDFVIVLLIGNIIAHPLSDEQLGLKGSMITIAVLAFLYLIGVFLILKVSKIRYFLAPLPFPLIENGQIIYENLGKARITIDFLLTELRKEKIEDVQKVAFALWEADGSISIFPNPKDQPVTASDIGLTKKPLDFPRTVIKEGKINSTELLLSGKDEKWLIQTLKNNHQVEVNKVLLATLNKDEQLKIFLY